MTQEKVYQGLYILDSERYARNPEEVSVQIAKTIESFGGTVRVSRLWEERKLAYPIKNHKRGTYWLAYFRLNADKVADLNRQFQLNNDIIRFLITNEEAILEETLVEHALRGPIKREEESAKPNSDSDFNDDDDDDEGDADGADYVDSIDQE